MSLDLAATPITSITWIAANAIEHLGFHQVRRPGWRSSDGRFSVVPSDEGCYLTDHTEDLATFVAGPDAEARAKRTAEYWLAPSVAVRRSAIGDQGL